MQFSSLKTAALASVLAAAFAAPAHAVVQTIFITEVAPWSSGNSTLLADWFEVTNTGTAAVDITGWKVDDNSNSSASAVALNGITSIGAGESVIFTESAASVSTSFKSLWFGSAPPAGLQVGRYSGSGIGLGTGGDTVNLFDASGNLQAKVTFGTATTSAPFKTFDNAALSNGGTISQLSAVGTNGAFAAFGNANEIGSPGTITAVPEPETYAMLLAGLAAVAAVVRRRRGA